MIKIKKLKIDFREKWDDFVTQNSGTIFHSWGWGEMLKESYGYKPIYLGAFENDNLVGVLPGIFWGRFGGHRLTSSPFADFAGPLGSDIAQMALLEEFQKKSQHVQVFSEFPLAKNTPFCHFVLDAGFSFETILKQKIHQKTRNMINRANREGIIVENFNGKKALKKYYPLYFKTLLKLNSLPFSEKIFKQLDKNFNDHNKVFIAFYKGKIVAAIWAFEWNKKLHIWGNASDSNYLNLGANNAVYAAAIEYACSQKLEQIDFGSTIPDTSHHFFKKRWGGDEKPIYVWGGGEYKTNSDQNKIVKKLKILPKFVLKPLCHLIYKYY